MTAPLLASVLTLCMPSMAHGVSPVHTGVVIAAPHEGFDDNTEPMAKAIAEQLGAGWVVARDYRSPGKGRWFDVNRPTQKRYEGGRAGKAKVTKQGTKVYKAYQKLLGKAGKRRRDPLELLVEIHGHARVAAVGERRVRVQVIELATRGFEEEELRALKARFEGEVAKLPKADRIQIAVEQLDPVYHYAGGALNFYFRASGAKKRGSLRPESAKRILHFEFPQAVRFEPERRVIYAGILAEVLEPLLPSE